MKVRKQTNFIVFFQFSILKHCFENFLRRGNVTALQTETLFDWKKALTVTSLIISPTVVSFRHSF